MRAAGRNRAEQKWLEELGKHIHQLILDAGYNSAYEFWIEKVGDDISKSGLNYIINGSSDPKASTIRMLAKHLDLKPSQLLDF